MILQNFLQNNEGHVDNQTLLYVFGKNLPIEKICRISSVMFDILLEILQSHVFLMSQNFEFRSFQC